MARKARAEVEGGLYHVITRGNNRRRIFDAPADYEKFLSLLAVQKTRGSQPGSGLRFVRFDKSEGLRGKRQDRAKSRSAPLRPFPFAQGAHTFFKVGRVVIEIMFAVV